MSSETAVTEYLISEPFDRGLKVVRESLVRSELRIAAELDISATIRRELSIALGPCRILLVDSPCLLLEACTLDRAAAALLPLHIVLCGRGPQTIVHFMSPAVLGSVRLPAGATAPLVKLHAMVMKSIQRVAMRRDILQTA